MLLYEIYLWGRTHDSQRPSLVRGEGAQERLALTEEGLSGTCAEDAGCLAKFFASLRVVTVFCPFVHCFVCARASP